MPPATGYDPIGTVQQAIVSLLNTNEPLFLAAGARLFTSFAVILLAWYGIRWMLGGGDIGDRVLGFAKRHRWQKPPSRRLSDKFGQSRTPSIRWDWRAAWSDECLTATMLDRSSTSSGTRFALSPGRERSIVEDPRIPSSNAAVNPQECAE